MAKEKLAKPPADPIAEKRQKRIETFLKSVGNICTDAPEVREQRIALLKSGASIITHNPKLVHANRCSNEFGAVFCDITRHDGYVHSLSVKFNPAMPDDCLFTVEAGGGAVTSSYKLVFNALYHEPSLIDLIKEDADKQVIQQVFDTLSKSVPEKGSSNAPETEIQDGLPTVAFLRDNLDTEVFTLIPSTMMPIRWRNAANAMKEHLVQSEGKKTLVRHATVRFGTTSQKVQNVTTAYASLRSYALVHATRKKPVSAEDRAIYLIAKRGLMTSLRTVCRGFGSNISTLVSALSTNIDATALKTPQIYDMDRQKVNADAGAVIGRQKALLGKYELVAKGVIADLMVVAAGASKDGFNRAANGHAERSFLISKKEGRLLERLRYCADKARYGKDYVSLSKDEIEDCAAVIASTLLSAADQKSEAQLYPTDAQFTVLHGALVDALSKEHGHV